MAPRPGCTRVPDPHRAFEVHNLGPNCWLYLYATEQDCLSGDPENFYTEAEEDLCIPAQFQWDYFQIEQC